MVLRGEWQKSNCNCKVVRFGTSKFECKSTSDEIQTDSGKGLSFDFSA